MSKERPIIFSAPLIPRILDGSKTMTRRIVKPQPWSVPYCDPYGNHDEAIFWRYGEVKEDWPYPRFCPYGVPGDRLWVRETFQDYCPIWSGGWCGHGTREGIEKEHGVWYGAGAPHRGPLPADPPLKWKPSIHMPRWASRITLEIVSVRVERVQEITEEDAKAEGAHLATWFIPKGKENDYEHHRDISGLPGYPSERPAYKNGFANLWESIHGEGSWDRNDWCWVIEFRRIA